MPTTTATYTVADTDEITADVLIGDGQPGGSTVSLGTTQLKKGGDTLTAVDVGTGRSIRGKKLIITSVVENKNPATNNTSTQVTIKGSTAPKEMEQKQAATSKGDIISYVTVVTFT